MRSRLTLATKQNIKTMKHIKFKFVPKDYDLEDLFEESEQIECPLHDSLCNRELPNGEYFVRLGNNEYKTYIKRDEYWFLIYHHKNDKTMKTYIRANYNLFPCLKDSEYKQLMKPHIFNKLTKQWRMNTLAYYYWSEWRATYRNVLKTIFEK